ncbi:MAG TPA: hypothetical protein VGJ01_25080, partial [Pseudolabrys sp.]
AAGEVSHRLPERVLGRLRAVDGSIDFHCMSPMREALVTRIVSVLTAVGILIHLGRRARFNGK